MNYLITHIAKILNAGNFIYKDTSVEYLLFDSRKVFFPASSLFFAIKGARRNGHKFIPELYKKGVRNFVVSEMIPDQDLPEANILVVDDGLKALHKLASAHRQLFRIPVIGITGSNGKTIVKEWLYQLLQENFNIVRSPKSYNSQIGVPLSVWEMNREHNLGIFEAGISQMNEMEKLQEIIRPTIGILTNIGEAHSGGFENADIKAAEKIKLFKDAGLIIYCSDDWMAEKAIVIQHEAGYHKTGKYPFSIFSWGRIRKSTLQVLKVEKGLSETRIIAFYQKTEVSIVIPFTDDASVQNAITCWCVLLYLGIKDILISRRMKLLQPVNMRLELIKGINHCTLINDSYSADLSSLRIALNFLQQQGGISKKTLILSDFFQTGLKQEELYHQVAAEIAQYKIDRVIAIGLNISKHLKLVQTGVNKINRIRFYSSTEDFITRFSISDFRDETILVKGARLFHFERIIQQLEQKVHQTELEINLNAIAHNLNQYQQYLSSSTSIMAMVKAFAYGSGGAEIANKLQYLKVDYLGVAYADEGVELRKSGNTLPLMVMNAETSTFDVLVNNNLEPAIFSITMLKKLDNFLKKEGIKNYPVHLELETGMNRLGFAKDELSLLAKELSASSSFRIKSVFTHLAASEDPAQDTFTRQQFEHFTIACRDLQKALGYTFLCHIANSAAILRHPEMQLDMVRLGIGLYGVDSAISGKIDLHPVAKLKSTIAQVKLLKKGESIGYNSISVLEKDSAIATVSI
ncbi:MAG TPA: bifunctional UDP-N-acetylmuramoyl-tripeptide:D-alanyl-D-alanine ligase/alanine racemase, partial [Chitinophagaceae bacterium]|nr:bifunctional UDP-N-acetylmuramoyl-tripeptide:D-alanyl-D-alanine ligase/alanine racemase [Chitinophagaceae bacterium]